MENNIFEKMLFESNQTFKQIKGMKSLNEAEEIFKPKLSAKKQLGTYKLVTLNSENYILIQEIGPTNKDGYVLKVDGYEMKYSISDIFENDKIGDNWWSVSIHEEDAGNYTGNSKEVLYLLDNFEALMK